MKQSKTTKPLKDRNNFKGSGYKGKGGLNTDAVTFNHRRKGGFKKKTRTPTDA